MAESKTAEQFGIDSAQVESLNWSLALSRIVLDLRTDFIYAPHLSFIYAKAGDELVTSVKQELLSGKYSPGLPMTVEVAKSFRIRVAVTAKRLGPAYSRPGSILLPRDRLLYQALADQAAPIVDAKTDHTRSFSHRLNPKESDSLFLSTRTCWNALQKALTAHSKDPTVNYILKIDIANFFGSLNQHTLINILNDAGFNKSLSSRLETILVRYTGERSSRGIIQGIYPSDLFGNFYLAPIDQFLADYGVGSARYVDDIYIFLETVEAAEHLLRQLIPALRTYDLVLNEAKSVIMPKSALITEEPDLEALFTSALDEISEQIEEEVSVDYGFQSEWYDDDETSEEEDSDEDLELKATTALFDSISDYPGHEENIERFCLPLFAHAESDYATSQVLDAFKKRPSMAQIYCAYLAKFIEDERVSKALLGHLGDAALSDWQKIWILGALSQVDQAGDEHIRAGLAVLRDGTRHEALRAVAAVYVGRFGSLARRKALVAIYSTVSTYIQVAIYYSSRFWPQVERANARASWSGHSELHGLMTIALAKK